MTKYIILSLIAFVLIDNCYGQNTRDNKLTNEKSKNEVWKMEEKYWFYVKQNDTISYLKLWHKDFIGYPGFGDGVSNKSHIAIWINDLHIDSTKIFDYALSKKAVNMIDDVVMVFYDVDEFWNDKDGKAVKKKTIKATHTWKKYGNTWLILGGMAGPK